MRLKIQCEAIARHSGERCKCKGYFTPNSRRMLCRFHGSEMSINSKTRQYQGLYRNKKVNIENKIKILKNLINFKNKTDDEIRSYIEEKQERAKTLRFRSEFYNRSYTRWRNTIRVGKRFTDQLEHLIQISRPKSKG